MEKAKNLEKDYITTNLLAYIGNKRRLLPLLSRAIDELKKNGSQKIKDNGYFIDYFAGTGVVSRFAKSSGFKVISNDWEKYSYIINKSFIENSENVIRLFENEGGLKKIIEKLNNNTTLDQKNSYISKYYCPKNDKTPDSYRERMFYTHQNGVLIDNIRAEIDKLYPLKKGGETSIKNRFLLSLLLYESSRRANTSGVFKGFHNGFGGKKGDALGRILKKITLEIPTLSTQNNRCKVFQSDALKLATHLKNMRAEVVYLDPPYNQHQYGSNYHLLNTIAKNDKPHVEEEFRVGKKVVDKSAIRKDWVKTKSPFCYKKSAINEFTTLINKINSKYLMISYSTEGIIPFETMLSILAQKGRVGIVTTGYVRYRGGRQANTTKNKNIEFVILVDTALKSREQDINNIKGIILDNNFQNIMNETFPVNEKHKDYLLEKNFSGFAITLKGFKHKIYIDNQLTINNSIYDTLAKLTYDEKNELYKRLKSYQFTTNTKEVRFLINQITSKKYMLDYNYLSKRLIRLFGKINPKKEREEYEDITSMLQHYITINSLFSGNSKLIKSLNRYMKAIPVGSQEAA